MLVFRDPFSSLVQRNVLDKRHINTAITKIIIIIIIDSSLLLFS